MVHLYYGENQLAIRRTVDKIADSFASQHGAESVSKIDAANINPTQMIGEIININLFTPRRLIVLSNAAGNKEAWESLAENLTRLPEETELVIVEPSPDKRTRTFKLLQKTAKTREFALPKHHDLTKFVLDEAAQQQVEIKADAASLLISYTSGDVWRIANEIAKFRALNRTITSQSIAELVEPDLSASAFNILDNSLSGRTALALKELVKLRQIEDANKFLGLLASQVFALAAAVNAGSKSSQQVAKDLGLHPFMMGKLFNTARGLKSSDVAKLARIVAETDAKIKTSGGDPWLLVELAISKF